ncbi:unnamed protein product [Parascedosporium putredinis]|uniref:Uncharacterized protein n=1 Tax=Parascedosporium putredinis TaxID=1442378 RepID=A0A9P1M819_9PEZI|nr:unnamed protein product [Parascedosporium putredinis]CAI7989033.1 unnamed protein product [Parascedosporium putredinis]
MKTADAVRKAAKDAGRVEPNVLVLEMDVCDRSSVEAAAKRVEEEWGQLDILVNNAGHMAEFASLLDVDEEDYMRAWDVNYWGVFRTTKAFLPLMLKGGDKTIVNLSSVAAHYAGVGGGAYHVSKFALARFTECVQDEYGAQRREFLGGRWLSCRWDLPRLLEMEDEIVAKDLLKFKCTGLWNLEA